MPPKAHSFCTLFSYHGIKCQLFLIESMQIDQMIRRRAFRVAFPLRGSCEGRSSAQEGIPVWQRQSGKADTSPYLSRHLKTTASLFRAFLLLLWLGRFVEVPFLLEKNGVCLCGLAYTHRRNASGTLLGLSLAAQSLDGVNSCSA